MTGSDKGFSGSMVEVYDALTVPLIFAGYADDLATRAAALAPHAVLETAAGTGAVARALAPRLAAGARYVVTDLSQPMLDQAARHMGADARLEWRQADALALPFAEHSFDVVCCQFGAMFFPDRVAGYAEARRVLRPGGSLIFSVWDRLEANELAEQVTAALAGLFPHDSPRFMARVPHGYFDTAQIRAEVQQAGFTDIQLATRDDISRAPSVREVAAAFCGGTPLRAEIEARQPGGVASATAHVAEALARRYGSGPVAAGMRAHIVSARA